MWWRWAGATPFSAARVRRRGYGAGWYADGGWRATTWLSLVGEVGRHRRRQDIGFIDVETNVDSAMAGVRILHRRRRFAPFVQILLGAVRVELTTHLAFPVDSVAGETGAYGTMQIGGGIQLPLSARLAVRIGADYRHVFNAYRFAPPPVSSPARYTPSADGEGVRAPRPSGGSCTRP